MGRTHARENNLSPHFIFLMLVGIVTFAFRCNFRFGLRGSSDDFRGLGVLWDSLDGTLSGEGSSSTRLRPCNTLEVALGD